MQGRVQWTGGALLFHVISLKILKKRIWWSSSKPRFGDESNYPEDIANFRCSPGRLPTGGDVTQRTTIIFLSFEALS